MRSLRLIWLFFGISFLFIGSFGLGIQVYERTLQSRIDELQDEIDFLSNLVANPRVTLDDSWLYYGILEYSEMTDTVDLTAVGYIITQFTNGTHFAVRYGIIFYDGTVHWSPDLILMGCF